MPTRKTIKKKRKQTGLEKVMKKMIGSSPMNNEEKKLLAKLRAKVKAKEITVTEAHRIWDEKT